MGKQVKVLETLIRKIVREEIQKGVPKAIQEAMKPKINHEKSTYHRRIIYRN
jgi:hypothetical protein